jgi:hypothetical protein
MKRTIIAALVAALSTPAASQTSSRPSFPPPEFDHEYVGQLIVTKWSDFSLLRHVCREFLAKNVIACTYFTQNASRKPIACLIMLGPTAWNDERTLRHELAHCNGWESNHAGGWCEPGWKADSVQGTCVKP